MSVYLCLCGLFDMDKNFVDTVRNTIVVLTEDNLPFRTAFSDFEQQTFRTNSRTIFLSFSFLFLSLLLLACLLGWEGQLFNFSDVCVCVRVSSLALWFK